MPSADARILMCPPDHFGIEYEINPWMRVERPSDRGVALEQWMRLRQRLQEAGAQVECLAPQPGLPDLVFTANAALIHRRRAILAQFRHPQRQAEQPLCAAWFAAHGFEVVHLPANMPFEGAGDALFCGETLFAGYRIRSDVRGHQWIAAELGVQVIPLELVEDRFYHLDTCFCPLAPGVAVYYPPAFDEYAQRALQAHVGELIAVNDDEARHFACNAVVVGRTVITNTACPDLHRQLHARGYHTLETPLGEFLKAGGSAKCLTLRLDGEDAAVW